MFQRPSFRFPGIASFLCAAGLATGQASEDPPHILLIVADDLGYADLGCQGAVDFDTPHLDRLAASGTRFTSFYSAASLCSPSRAALLTGRYPARLGIEEDFGPAAQGGGGMDAEEVTLAEILKEKGYATACIGNWHLGNAPQHLPTKQGFDRYFGIPYSNDLGWWPGKPEGEARDLPPLPLLDGERVLETSPDQRFLTRRYTEEALAFLEERREEPCFVYLAYSAPHVPLFVSPEFSGKARYGLYGDVVSELDSAVGDLLAGLERLGIAGRTLVIFTSDHGPNLREAPHAGRADPFRDGAGSRFEGGHRVPFLLRWPGRVPEGRVAEGMAASIDVLPTLATLAGATLPPGLKIDGLDLTTFWTNTTSQSPRTRFFHSEWVVRDGNWKLFLPGKYRELSPRRAKAGDGWTHYSESRLHDLATDAGERKNLAARHPEKVAELAALLKAWRDELRPPAPDSPDEEEEPAKKK